MTAAPDKVKDAMSLPRPTAAQLLRWYDAHGRDLPWRMKGGKQEPYKVWLSEIMLQQTVVATVIPYYEKFLHRWPTIDALATASLDDIRTAWAGLGYYQRAANLHRCAQTIVAHHDGVFPIPESALKQLPGVGEYTAAAIGAIAFDRPTNVVDGNVERIMARLFMEPLPLPHAKATLKAHAATLVPKKRNGDYAQALMDLGATICTPKNPKCLLCPWRKSCAAHAAGATAAYPVLAAKRVKPVRRAVAFWLEDENGAVWLRQRAEGGLLSGMTEVPSSPWLEQDWPLPETYLPHAPINTTWQALPEPVRHSFTHFDLYIRILYAKCSVRRPDGIWATTSDIQNLALPSIMQKIWRAIINWGTR